jgi:ornithine decarboxylase
VASLTEVLARVTGKEVTHCASVAAYTNARIESGAETASFLVTNLATVVKQFDQWKRELPMVEPFYAFKCNPDVAIVRLLASLGCSFDCATQGEIDTVLHGLGDELSFARRVGRAASSIVYANPAKMESMLDFAITHGVRMTVFDGEDELRKIAAMRDGSQMQLLLRLTTDDSASLCRFSKKFGCPVGEAPHLLEVAHQLGLHVAGVSFHVGSGCGDTFAYVTALDHARRVFEEGERIGMAPMTIVDIGGGFPGDMDRYGGPDMPTFQDIAATVRAAMASFSASVPRAAGGGVRFIAEPGRFFVSACTSVATKVHSRKGGQAAYQALYVDDGIYGSFNTVVYDHAWHSLPQRMASVMAGSAALAAEPRIPSAVFGPTCDDLDQICALDACTLPRVEVGEWLYWDNMGAYTHTASFDFNGFTHRPTNSYVYCK